jgi:hypothetical protein
MATLRFTVDHESLRGLRELHASLPEAARADLLRATAAMPHQLLSDAPMDRLAFARFRDLAEQAAAAGKLAAFADAVAAKGEATGSTCPSPSREQWTLARFAALSGSLRAWGDELEDACAAFGVEPRLRVFERR